MKKLKVEFYSEGIGPWQGSVEYTQTHATVHMLANPHRMTDAVTLKGEAKGKRYITRSDNGDMFIFKIDETGNTGSGVYKEFGKLYDVDFMEIE